MADIAKLEVTLDLDAGQFSSRIVRAGQDLKQFGTKIDNESVALAHMESQAKRTADSVSVLGKAAVAFAGFEAIKRGADMLIKAQVDMQQIQFTLVGALGTKSQMVDAFDFLRKESQMWGLDLRYVAAEFAKIAAAATALGVPMKQQKDLFDALARASTVLHLSSDQQKFATMAITQMFSKGKIQAEELRRQIGEQIPGVVARFQQSVMKMVQGTDLAGNSFDQLLRKGLLTTDKFLPALIEALKGAGQGAEDAAKGLNAQINKLKTNWFLLENELSKGLFNDVATSGIEFVANHLERIATTLTVIAGISVARTLAPFLGGKVQPNGSVEGGLIGPMVSQHNKEKDLITQAEMDKKVAEETALRVKNLELSKEELLADQRKLENEIALSRAKLKTATVGSDALFGKFGGGGMMDSAARIAALQSAQASAQGRLGAAVKARLADERQIVLLEQEAAVATTKNARQQVEATIEEIEIRRKGHMADAIAAQARMNAAQVQIAAETRIAELKGVAATNNLALTGARTQNEVAQAAATASAAAASLATRAKTAVKGLGSVLLSLVGGPWGAAILAVVGLSYAFYKISKASADSKRAVDDQVKSLDLANASAGDLVDTFKSGDFGAEEINHSLQVWVDLNKQLDSTKEKIDNLIKYGNAAPSFWSRLTGGKMVGMPTLADLQAGKPMPDSAREVLELQQQLAPTQEKMNQLREAMQGALDPGTFKAFDKAMRDLNTDKLDEVRAKLTDVQQAAFDAETGFASDMQKYQKMIDKNADTILDLEKGKGTSLTKHLNEKIDTLVKTAMASDPSARSKLLEDGATWVKIRDTLISQDKKIAGLHTSNSSSKRDAAKQVSEYNSLTKTIQEHIAVLKEEMGITPKLTETQKLAVKLRTDMGLATSHLSAVEKKRLEADVASMLALDAKNEKLQKQKVLTEALAQLQDRLDESLDASEMQNDSALIDMEFGSNEADKMKRMADIKKEHARDLLQLGRDAKTNHWEVGGDEYNQELQEYDDFTDARIAKETRFQDAKKRLEGDWRAGLESGMADWLHTTGNINASMRSMVGETLNQTTDMFINMVNTGKASWKELMTFVLKEIERVLMAKAVAGLANFVIGLFGGQQGNTTSGTAGNYFGGYDVFNQRGSLGFANGGVMSSKGAMPLNYYATGGVADSPQLAMFGEGRMPEAYVPLPDGRSIPVTITGGGANANQVNVQVNVQSDGQSSSKSDGKSALARQFGDLLAGGVRKIMTDEMRQGGLLWKMNHGVAAA